MLTAAALSTPALVGCEPGPVPPPPGSSSATGVTPAPTQAATAVPAEPSVLAVRESEGGRLLELETNPDDRGRVIGRQGRVAKAMRALLGVSRDGADCRLDIVD